MSLQRLAVSNALFAIGSAVQWGTPAVGWATTGKRLLHWTDCPAQPAMFQVRHDEQQVRGFGKPPRIQIDYKWVIYHDYAKSPGVVPSDMVDQIMDAVSDSMTGDQYFDNVCTLGGLVNRAWIEGDVFSDDGSLDGQGVIVVPLHVLVPA